MTFVKFFIAAFYVLQWQETKNNPSVQHDFGDLSRRLSETVFIYAVDSESIPFLPKVSQFVQ